MGIFLVAYGFKLDQVMTWYADGGRSSVDLILILMSVGTVIGTWMASGAVPTIVYYGLKMLTPTSFMIIGFLLCCIVSFFIGSSYSTLATLGVAFIGIGTGLGMNLGLVGGGAVRSHVRRQDVAVLRHHQSGSGCLRNNGIPSYQFNDIYCNSYHDNNLCPLCNTQQEF